VETVERKFSTMEKQLKNSPLMIQIPLKSKQFCLLLVTLFTMQQKIASEEMSLFQEPELKAELTRIGTENGDKFELKFEGSRTLGIDTIYQRWGIPKSLFAPYLYALEYVDEDVRQHFCLRKENTAKPIDVYPNGEAEDTGIVDVGAGADVAGIFQFVSLESLTHSDPINVQVTRNCCPPNGYKIHTFTSCWFLADVSEVVNITINGVLTEVAFVERILQEITDKVEGTHVRTFAINPEQAKAYVDQGLLKLDDNGAVVKMPRVVLIDASENLIGIDSSQDASKDEDQKTVLIIVLAVFVAIFAVAFLITLLYFLCRRKD
jgi:hypothetical protein